MLAQRLNISRQSIYKWEQGRALPSFANVILLSDIFGVTIDELIRGDDQLIRSLVQPPVRPLGLVVVISLGIAILGAFILLGVRISVTTVTDWIQTPILLGTMVLLGLIYQRQRQHIYPLSRVALGVAVIVLTLLLLPQVMDIALGFWAGLREQG
ncbi:helix-turn-helix transcriptional regulator [Levilactobacillus tujiorum]|uniref:Helix-turn-helix transcriptional regulator n=1 Tax=Levilactobacillus tujiorum TaxID=2912243 RepID=A0ABX1L486_9LACO|nr:helix-turn-helix transcriptional regulator [Lactobacillus sp. HBUAS51387]NLR29835.1 helix-turn-helix transcriptional regulator [Levilactobacillus tujiorum]